MTANPLHAPTLKLQCKRTEGWTRLYDVKQN